MSNKINKEDVVLNAVLSLVSSNTTWVGTMTALRRNLLKVVDKSLSKNIPRSESALRTTLNRVVNRIRVRRISVMFGRTHDHAGIKFVKFVAR